MIKKLRKLDLVISLVLVVAAIALGIVTSISIPLLVAIFLPIYIVWEGLIFAISTVSLQLADRLSAIDVGYEGNDKTSD